MRISSAVINSIKSSNEQRDQVFSTSARYSLANGDTPNLFEAGTNAAVTTLAVTTPPVTTKGQAKDKNSDQDNTVVPMRAKVNDDAKASDYNEDTETEDGSNNDGTDHEQDKKSSKVVKSSTKDIIQHLIQLGSVTPKFIIDQ
jgi:hypothetical protein